MVDIFISYSREDRAKAKRLAEALDGEGWTIWWDTLLRAGEIWDDRIEKEIRVARAVVVLWSGSSIRSTWVKNEARVANKMRALVPALLQDVEPPVEYSHVHAADLIGWEGDRAHSGFQQLLEDLFGMLGPPMSAALEPAPPSVASSAGDDKRAEWPQSRPQQAYTQTHAQQKAKSASRWHTAPRILKETAAVITGIAAVIGALAVVTTILATPPQPTKSTEPSIIKTPPVPPHTIAATPLTHDCEQCPEMIKIPSGEFLMGSDQEGRPANERPQHRVAIREFAIGKYEVTRDEYARFVKDQSYKASEDGCYVYPGGNPPEIKDASKNWRNPGFEQTDRDPVVCVSWTDAKAYVKWLSERTQKPYRLLTEAEWEYAAQAGIEAPYPPAEKSTCKEGNFQGCVGKTIPADRYPPNSWGVYGMLGNAWEWVEDTWHGNYYGAPADGSAWNDGDKGQGVWRGGSWGSEAKNVLLTTRRPQNRDHSSYKAGFRVAKTL